jgi:hypothetical protein
MSFDIFLQKFSEGKPAEANREAVLAVLNKVAFTGPDKFGFHIVKFPDGVDVEFSAKELYSIGEFTGCAFNVREMSPHLIKFIFEIAKAGDMIILPSNGDSLILSLPDQNQHLPQDLAENDPPPVVCESAAELEALLCGGYEQWRKYRDKFVSGSGKT